MMNSYPSYKDSGVEWIGEIPNHWEVCKLKHCGKLICGGTPSTNKDEYWNGNIPWIQSGKIHFKKITIDDVDEFITELGFEKSSTKMVRRDSPVIAITGESLLTILVEDFSKPSSVINSSTSSIVIFLK